VRVALLFIFSLLFGFTFPRVEAGEQPAWTSVPGGRFLPLNPAPGTQNGFTRMPSESTGIRFTNQLATSRYLTNQNLLNGSGVALGDIDGDGLAEIFLCGLDSSSTLYHNLGGWKFTDVTESFGVSMKGLTCTGAAFADLDGDGDLDLIVNTFGSGTYIFENIGQGSFKRRTSLLENLDVLNPRRAAMSLALADVDGDGTLDIYITNYRRETVRDVPNAKFDGEYVNGKPVVKTFNGRPISHPDLAGRFVFAANGQIIENGELDAFYLNQGYFKFKEVPLRSPNFNEADGGILQTLPWDWGLSCMFRDLNGDQAPDLYVCNDFASPDRIWLNDGRGKFRALPPLALRHTCRFSMGIDFADINRDGLDDFFVADMLSRSHLQRQTREGIPANTNYVGEIENRPQYSQNALYLNRGDGTYTEIACFAGVQASEWSWMPAFLDVDLDGYEDLLITTGNEQDSMDADIIVLAESMKKSRPLTPDQVVALRKMYKPLRTPRIAFRNERNLKFTDQSHAWGFDEPGVSHGMAFADLDGDGDLDIVVNNLNTSVSLYQNNSPAPRLAVRLKGTPPNTRGIGAKIQVKGGPVIQQQEMVAGGRYLSSDDPMRVFAAGTIFSAGKIEVTWRSGKVTSIENVSPNRLYEIEEKEAETRTTNPALDTHVWFEDVSDKLNHRHYEEPFDDWERQPLLPYRLSQSGPGVAWHDVNGDGWDDVIIGTGRRGKLALFENNTLGGFTNSPLQALQRPVARDQTTVLGLGTILLTGSSNWEDGRTNGGAMRVYDLKRNAAGENLLGVDSCTGPLAMADVDGDGNLDLFVGGRAIAGRYPESASSAIYLNEGSRFTLKQKFERVGLVSGAVFSDIDGDGDPDLILACHWGPIRVFVNEKGTFREATEPYGLSAYTGLWNGLATGDFDNDGRPDLIASNWGLNSRWTASNDRPLKIYFGDFDDNGVLDIIEAQYDLELKKEVPLRTLNFVGAAIPLLKEKIKSFAQFGAASVQEILGDKFKGATVLQARTLSSMLFLNRGDHFEARELPAEAQFSTAFGISIGDLDADGNLDLFLSQNFFGTNPEMPRNDGGLGLILKGDGQGHFSALSPRESGLRIFGEGRGAALGDYDHDGRWDLLVAQNGASTKLFHNKTAKSGVRIVIRGPESNSEGVGTQVRTEGGPLQEIQRGSGYSSQNAASLILPQQGLKQPLKVKIPGKQQITLSIPENAKAVEINYNGELKVTE
jgi:hypothetical protein